jgi:hypothetical protein
MGNSDIVEKETIGTYLRLRYMASPTEIQRKYQLGDLFQQLFQPWSDAVRNQRDVYHLGLVRHIQGTFRSLLSYSNVPRYY